MDISTFDINLDDTNFALHNNLLSSVSTPRYTNQIPRNVEELGKFSHDAYLKSAQRDQNVGQIAIAYTVWSKKKVVEN